jgi:ABC-type hemin transport system ATPase subunit
MKIDQLLQRELKEFGASLNTSSRVIRAFTAQEVVTLATLSGKKGFEEAAEAATDRILAKAGIAFIERAEEADARARSIVFSLLVGAATA